MVKTFSRPGLDSYFELKDPFGRPNVGFQPAIFSCVDERKATAPHQARKNEMLFFVLLCTHLAQRHSTGYETCFTVNWITANFTNLTIF